MRFAPFAPFALFAPFTRLARRLAPLALLPLAAAALAADCDDPRPLRLALVPMKSPETQAAQYRPLVQALQKQLDRRVELVAASSYGNVIEGLVAGGIDLAELGPASYAIALQRGAGITAFASPAQQRGPHTDSGSAYRSLLVVRRASGLDRLDKLRGATLSLTDPASTSGALLPRQAIRQLTGATPEAYFKRVTFAGSHDRAIEAVQKGLVDAAFVSSSRLDEVLRRGTLQADELAVVWQSAPMPYDPIVLRKRLCAPLQARIRRAFLNDTAALQGMFRELGIQGFVATEDAHYREIRSLFAPPAEAAAP